MSRLWSAAPLSAVGPLAAVEVLCGHRGRRGKGINWYIHQAHSRVQASGCSTKKTLRPGMGFTWDDQGGVVGKAWVLREIKPVNRLKGRYHPIEFAFGQNKCRSRSLLKLSSQKLASGQ